MVISLIGYSGIGKTLLASRLEQELGWLRLSCDKRIEARLSGELPPGALSGEARLAAWMGFPWESDSASRQSLYLLLEEQVVDEICDELEKHLRSGERRNIVVDTTGSCVYLSHDVLNRLRKFSHLIFLEAGPDEEAALMERFFSSPKPIIWGDLFNELPGESREEAIRRCYPKLLHSRRALYQQLADANLAIDPPSRKAMTAEAFVKRIEEVLPQQTMSAR